MNTIAMTTPRLAALVAMTALLAACGGGGGGSAPAPSAPIAGGPVAAPTPVAPTPATAAPVAGVDFPLPAQTQVAPAVYGTSATEQERLQAFTRLNEIRTAVGLGLLRQNAALDQAAMDHIGYMNQNNWGHKQTPGQPGFTGVNSADRAAVRGYSTQSVTAVTEISVSIAPQTAVWETSASMAEGLVNAIFHRMAALDPGFVDVGVGVDMLTRTNGFRALVINPGKPSATPMGQEVAARDGIAMYPAPGAIDMPHDNGGETPTPPGAGLAASLHCHGRGLLTATSFVMREAATGAVVETRPISRGVNEPTTLLQPYPCFQAIIPVGVLKFSTQYAVEFVGVHTVGGQAMPVSRQWSFTTGAGRMNYFARCLDGSWPNSAGRCGSL